MVSHCTRTIEYNFYLHVVAGLTYCVAHTHTYTQIALTLVMYGHVHYRKLCVLTALTRLSDMSL